MNELETQLSTILQKAIEVAEKSGEFAIEQAPLLLQEFYQWHIMKCSLGICLALLLFIAAIAITKIVGSKEEISEFGDVCGKFMGRYYTMNSSFVAGFGSGSLMLFSIVALSMNIYKLAFIIVAPKLYLIEYFLK